MKIATLVARILLGLGFAAQVVGFFVSPPPDPGLAGTFDTAFYGSHWALYVCAALAVAGVLLLINRYVPAALIVIAAFLYNSFAFHITMAQSSLAAPAIVFVLWLVVALPYRERFATLFTGTPPSHGV